MPAVCLQGTPQLPGLLPQSINHLFQVLWSRAPPASHSKHAAVHLAEAPMCCVLPRSSQHESVEYV